MGLSMALQLPGMSLAGSISLTPSKTTYIHPSETCPTPPVPKQEPLRRSINSPQNMNKRHEIDDIVNRNQPTLTTAALAAAAATAKTPPLDNNDSTNDERKNDSLAVTELKEAWQDPPSPQQSNPALPVSSPTTHDAAAFPPSSTSNEPLPNTSSSNVCRICGQGPPNDARPLLCFQKAAVSSSLLDITTSHAPFLHQDVYLHLFCGKTASLPTRHHAPCPELEIMTKSGLKHKHGHGPDVHAAIASTRWASVVASCGGPDTLAAVRDKHQFYIVQELEAHLWAACRAAAAVRHDDDDENTKVVATATRPGRRGGGGGGGSGGGEKRSHGMATMVDTIAAPSLWSHKRRARQDDGGAKATSAPWMDPSLPATMDTAYNDADARPPPPPMPAPLSPNETASALTCNDRVHMETAAAAAAAAIGESKNGAIVMPTNHDVTLSSSAAALSCLMASLHGEVAAVAAVGGLSRPGTLTSPLRSAGAPKSPTPLPAPSALLLTPRIAPQPALALSPQQQQWLQSCWHGFGGASQQSQQPSSSTSSNSSSATTTMTTSPPHDQDVAHNT